MRLEFGTQGPGSASKDRFEYLFCHKQGIDDPARSLARTGKKGEFTSAHTAYDWEEALTSGGKLSCSTRCVLVGLLCLSIPIYSTAVVRPVFAFPILL